MGGFPECLSSASDHDRVFFFFPVCCWRMQQKFWDGTCFCIITGFVLNFGANSYFTYLHPPSGCYWWSQWVGSHRGRSGADEVQSCIDSRRWWSSNNLGEQLSLSLSLSLTHTHTHTHDSLHDGTQLSCLPLNDFCCCGRFSLQIFIIHQDGKVFFR
jgi:hypothetical protein